jgi:AraC-type DNA-binding domain-containing proteins
MIAYMGNQPLSLREHTVIPDPGFPVNVFHVRQPYDTAIPPHWHEYAEWMLVRSGRFRVQLESGFADLGQGSVVFVVPGLVHSAFPIGEGTEILAIVFDETLVRSAALDGAELGCALPLLRGDLALPFALGADDAATKRLRGLLRRIEVELGSRKGGYELFVKAALIESLAELYRATRLVEVGEGGAALPSRSTSPIAVLLRRLCTDYMEPISVDEAASECALSKSYFCHAFKKATGKTLLEYLHTLRLIEAERMLAETDQPIHAIANAVGFEDPAYFGRVFRAMRGVSPRQARERARRSHARR